MDPREQYRIAPDKTERISVSVTRPGGSSISGQVFKLSTAGERISMSFPSAGGPILVVGQEVVLGFTSKLFKKQLTASARVVQRVDEGGARSYGFRFTDPQQLESQISPELDRLFSRRASYRVEPAPDSPVDVTLEGSQAGMQVQAQLVNISAGGVGVHVSPVTESKLAGVGRVKLLISLPGHLDALRLYGVIRNRYTVNGQIHYGIEFEFELSEESQRFQAAIINYVAERQRQHP